MGVRFLASSSGQADNIMKCSYLMEVGIAPWTLHRYTPAKKVTKIKKTASIGVEAEQYMNLNSCFKLAVWYIRYIILLLHYFHCKTTTNEDDELEFEKNAFESYVV